MYLDTDWKTLTYVLMCETHWYGGDWSYYGPEKKGWKYFQQAIQEGIIIKREYNARI